MDTRTTQRSAGPSLLAMGLLLPFGLWAVERDEDLFDDSHQQFFDGLDGSRSTEIPRNVYPQLDARF